MARAVVAHVLQTRVERAARVPRVQWWTLALVLIGDVTERNITEYGSVQALATAAFESRQPVVGRHSKNTVTCDLTT